MDNIPYCKECKEYCIPLDNGLCSECNDNLEDEEFDDWEFEVKQSGIVKESPYGYHVNYQDDYTKIQEDFILLKNEFAHEYEPSYGFANNGKVVVAFYNKFSKRTVEVCLTPNGFIVPYFR